ncbi:MAG TPA: hypothetical protein QGH28_07495, partial [Chloroflexota bacterium]|nr:hypothetical protein [Chloroflexota bacterium]
LQVSGNLQVGTGSLTLTSTGLSSTNALTLTSGGAQFTYPTSVGSSDQLLKTDNAGNLSWVTEAVSSTTMDVAQNNIVLNAFRLSMLTATSTQQNQDMIIEEFTDETGIDTATSTNVNYNATGFYTSSTTDAVAAVAAVDEVTAISAPTGGTITTSGGNTIHTFTSSGTFTVNTGASGNVEYLVVAGGGSGGNRANTGGGGGGGYLEHASKAVTAQGYTVTVGGGGTGGSNVNGSNSSFHGSTAIGGGYSNQEGSSGNSGGSGGGGGASASGGSGTQGDSGGATGYGNNGGAGDGGGSVTAGGGGGGAGAAGSNSTSGNGGTGGAGRSSDITGSAVTYAGGGGGSSQFNSGGAGGSGGGGNGGAGGGNGGAGTANLGGGGGGSSTGTSGAGGSGVVIIAFTTGDLSADAVAAVAAVSAVATTTDNITLISNTTVAETQPSEATMVMLVENSTTTPTLNTDIKAWVTRAGDSGDITQNWTQITLTDEGDFDTNRQIFSGSADISGQTASTSMRYKITTHGSWGGKIHGVSMRWKVTGADVAEWFKVGEADLTTEGQSTLEAGELVCTDTT